MLREQQGTAPAHVRVWAEEGCTAPKPRQAAEPLNPAQLRLPIWTDAVLQSAHNQQLPASGNATAASNASIQLPQSITWQCIPEPMRVTALRLAFGGHAAAEIQQGMVCGFTLTILGPDHEMAGGHQQDEVRRMDIAPASFVVHDQATLSVSLDVPIGVDERVSLTAVGSVCGPGDAVYLASWSKPSTSQSFMDDAMETAYVLSHGDAATGDACLVQVFLHQAEDAGDMIFILTKVEHGCGVCIVAELLCMTLPCGTAQSQSICKAAIQATFVMRLCLMPYVRPRRPLACRSACDGCCFVQMSSHQAQVDATPSLQPTGFKITGPSRLVIAKCCYLLTNQDQVML